MAMTQGLLAALLVPPKSRGSLYGTLRVHREQLRNAYTDSFLHHADDQDTKDVWHVTSV
jgi:hypothetical protein